jgi:8-oxo-dGTP diphosphatase
MLGVVEDTAALEGVPMRLTIFAATIDRVPRPAAELAHLGWFVAGDERATILAPARPEFAGGLRRPCG